MGKVQKLEPKPGQNIKDLDQSSLKVPLWTNPGGGYSYSSPAPHIASIVLRHVTGMELQDYIGEKLGKPQGDVFSLDRQPKELPFEIQVLTISGLRQLRLFCASPMKP